MTGAAIPGLDDVLAAERPRLVRLCARLTETTEAAEDLAQETLIEAWRNGHKLRAPDAVQSWLSGIARNVCLRWARRQGREFDRVLVAGGHVGTAGGYDMTEPPSDFDLDVELERDELATLLDRAMALLPAETRAALVAHYLEDAPQAAVAARLGVSEGAVAVRLHRGRLALRRLLATELREHAAPYGLVAPDRAGWQETRLWCPRCGGRRLGRFDAATGELALTCPACFPEPDAIPDHVTPLETGMPGLFRGIKGYQAALNRLAAWQHAYYAPALVRRAAPCVKCGAQVPLRPGLSPDWQPPPSVRRGAGSFCAATAVG